MRDFNECLGIKMYDSYYLKSDFIKKKKKVILLNENIYKFCNFKEI